MPVSLAGHDAPLPRSYCFISLARGGTIRTIRIRTGVMRSGIAAMAALSLWLIGSSLYLLFHDDLIASLMAREAQMQYAYEDRIAALRGQVQHEASLKLVGQSTIEGEVRALTQRAATLELRASLVSDLAKRLGPGKDAERMAGSRSAPLPGWNVGPHQEATDTSGEDETGSVALPRDGAPANGLAGFAGQRKPRPEADRSSPLGTPVTQNEAAQPLRLRLAAVTECLEHVDAAQYAGLAAVGDRARRRVDVIRSALASAGIAPERLSAPVQQPDAGGPFVPLDPAIEKSPFGRAVDALQLDVQTADSLTRALPRLPFAKPMPGALEVTSPYGARLDPFLGRPAMHTGVDLREDYGSDVRTTAAGRVVSAGPAGGYGVMVEIDHGHGLSTRYAHLSAVAVEPGQTVARGEVVGEVGATGRATGPHLHYETRIDGEAVDPMRFLQAGERLAALETLP